MPSTGHDEIKHQFTIATIIIKVRWQIKLHKSLRGEWWWGESTVLNAEKFKSIFHAKHSEFISSANIKAKVNTV